MEENRTEIELLKSPCDLHGRNATNFYQFIQSLETPVWIEKFSLSRVIDCSSLIAILSIGIVKDDEIKITAYDKKSLNDIVRYLNKLKN